MNEEDTDKLPHKIIHKLYGTVLARFTTKAEAEKWLQTCTAKYKDSHYFIVLDKEVIAKEAHKPGK